MPSQVRPTVDFALTVSSIRQPRDDEYIVMKSFASHAKRCSQCADPYKVHMAGGQLCERGHGLACDVGKYIYAKGSRPFSRIDRDQRNDRVEIEIPLECEIIRKLVKAIQHGATYKAKPVISQDRTYFAADRREPERVIYEEPNVIEIRPGNSSPRLERRDTDRYRRDEPSPRLERRKTYTENKRGSLYEKDENERRQRQQTYEAEPIYIISQPRRTAQRYYR